MTIYGQFCVIIDEEHAFLLEKIQEMETTLDFSVVVAYFKDHFEQEEKIMKDSGYPQYDGHKTEHLNMFVRLISMEARSGVEHLRELLKDILEQHVHTHDMLLLKHLKQQATT